MKLKLSDWASLAEVIGSLAVVLSLVFVGFQIQASTKAAQASAYDAWESREAIVQRHILASPDFVLETSNFGSEFKAYAREVVESRR